MRELSSNYVSMFVPTSRRRTESEFDFGSGDELHYLLSPAFSDNEKAPLQKCWNTILTNFNSVRMGLLAVAIVLFT